MFNFNSFRERASKPLLNKEKGSLNLSSAALCFFYLIITSAIFIMDTKLPMGVAIGVPYIVPIIFSKVSNRKSITFFIAIISSVLTIIGFFISSNTSHEMWICIANRALALLVISIVSMFVIHRISSERKIKDLNEKLKELANTDPLVEIGNRLHFNTILESELDRGVRYNKEFSLIYFDIDNFKHINDTYGHDVGDLALKELAELISGNIRKSDYFFRQGGDEFALVFTETGLRNAVLKAETLCEIVSARNYGILQHVTISMGVTSLIKNDTVKKIIKRADVALYKSKENGRNQVQTFNSNHISKADSLALNKTI